MTADAQGNADDEKAGASADQGEAHRIVDEMMEGLNGQDQQADEQGFAQPDFADSGRRGRISSMPPLIKGKAKPCHAEKRRAIPEQLADFYFMACHLAKLGLQQRQMGRQRTVGVCEGIPKQMRPGAEQDGNNDCQRRTDGPAAERQINLPMARWQEFNDPATERVKHSQQENANRQGENETAHEPMREPVQMKRPKNIPGIRRDAAHDECAEIQEPRAKPPEWQHGCRMGKCKRHVVRPAGVPESSRHRKLAIPGIPPCYGMKMVRHCGCVN
ncbi:MAG: hypothetical protein JWQ04_853 [Pedosphaera sp.]|nr:hypothetical protein [Pedosphaera sp.]